ncbi:MAG: hypothetical protein L6Q54_13910 [Leptospiraceae bacterium]|nr:thioesterase family protein [Leptospiraceae bacterium]MCK6382330.1 hypothetical protein [Leptospiraceae bacterium]NUM40888.1 thioesterase family protein [Leptospiraceae bacterium]
MESIYKNTTRFSDLDTQRHVNNIVYENLAESGRISLLSESGWTLEKLLGEEIHFRPVKCFVSFTEQQTMGTEIITKTKLFPQSDGKLHYSTLISNTTSTKTACQIEFLFEPRKKNKKFVVFENLSEKAPFEFEKVKKFSGSCSQISFIHTPNLSERNIFGVLPGASYWRIFEESRWDFMSKLGITFDLIKKQNSTMFYMGGTFHFQKEIPAGEKLKIYTWIDRIDKIWVYMRQDAFSEKNKDLLMSTNGRFLIVSVDKARPKKADEPLINLYKKYTENK